MRTHILKSLLALVLPTLAPPPTMLALVLPVLAPQGAPSVTAPPPSPPLPFPTLAPQGAPSVTAPPPSPPLPFPTLAPQGASSVTAPPPSPPLPFPTLAPQGAPSITAPIVGGGFATAPPATAAPLRTWGDQGDGTYRNPVLCADFSDPDVIFVHDRYYMVASDFHFLGMQVLESLDGVNWRYAAQIYRRFDLPGWDAMAHYAGGSWAPSIRYHDGQFYVYFCTPDEGLFMSTAPDAHGPWSPLHCVKRVEKWEDPCPFWDDDGRAYLGRSRHRAGPIIVHRMSPDGRQLLDDGVTVYTGPVAEGTKFLKRNGYYYLIIPEGGVGTGWQTVLRARSIYGPYERRVVLQQGATAVNGPHQGALVESPDGRWWFYHFQETPVLGRIVHLQPARWENDWPVIGTAALAPPTSALALPPSALALPPSALALPPSVLALPPSAPFVGGGFATAPRIGEPVVGAGFASAPRIGEPVVGAAFAPALSSAPIVGAGFASAVPSPVFSLQQSDEFASTLGLQWQWNHNPVDTHWSLTDRTGWLTLRPMPADSLKQCRNQLTQKVVGYHSTVTTLVTQKGNCFAGLLLSGKYFRGIGLTPEGIAVEMGKNCNANKGNPVEMGKKHPVEMGKKCIVRKGKFKKVYLRVAIDAERNRHQFYYSLDGRHYQKAGAPFALRGGYWKGIRHGLFCYGRDGLARFDYYRVTPE